MMVRPAQVEDLYNIMEVGRRAHSFPWSEQVMQQYLQRPLSAWVLEHQSSVLGHAVIRVIAGEGELLTIAIDPEQQGKGLGRVLLQQILTRFAEQHAEQCFLEVRASNDAAIRLYESLGFACAGVRRDDYPCAHGREDAWIDALDLTAHDIWG